MSRSLITRLVLPGIATLFLGLLLVAAGSALLGPTIGAYVALSLTVILSLLINYFGFAKTYHSAIDYLHQCAMSPEAVTHKLDKMPAEVNETAKFISDQHKIRRAVVGSGGRIAIAAAEVSFAADILKRRVHEQIEHIDEIGRSATSIAQTVEVAANTSENSVETAKLTRKASYIGQEFIQDATQQMQKMEANVEGASELISHLESKTDQIQEIAKVINGIAEQTNLLALNAAIEAARAGDQGRGFAVVADEVRNLAARTGDATLEIGQMIQEIDDETQRVVAQMSSLTHDVGESRSRTEKVDTQLLEILEHSRSVETQILEVAEGDKATHQNVEQISQSIHQVSEHLAKTESEVSAVSNEALELSEHAENIYALLAGATVDTVHDQMRVLAQEGAASVRDCFEEAIRSGKISEAVFFDRDYQPIPETDPTKFKTRFDDFTDRVLPSIQEPILDRFAFMIYSGAVDDNGYFPTHNDRYCKPLTGDPKVDLLNNRTKRMFNDRTGIRCAKNTKEFLLQTYKRDTGEVMHDMSSPITINGRHWGGFRIGYKASAD